MLVKVSNKKFNSRSETKTLEEKCEILDIWDVLGRRWSLLILKNLMNKAAGYVIKKYIYEIKNYKIDRTKPIQTEDDFYELIKDISSNDKEFQKFAFDNYRIRICYYIEKDSIYLECYS